jgi:hypothetical protein
MSERPQIQENNEEILFEGIMLELEKMHTDRQRKSFTESFISDGQTVTLTHKAKDPRRYDFSVPNPNRESIEDKELFSDVVFSVNFFGKGEVEVPHALLSVYKRINAAQKLGNLALEWEEVHRTTAAGVPSAVQRRRFENIFGDYLADRGQQQND